MARKSNKTAHVLNLIAGHEASKDNTEETTANEGTDTAGASATAPARAGAVPASSPSQNIAVIDTTEEDPISDLIQQKLSRELEEHLPAEPQTEPVTMSDPALEPPVEPPNPRPQPNPALQTGEEPQTEAQAGVMPDAQPQTIVPQTDTPAEPAQTALQTKTPTEPDPEPDFVRWNVMERIVEDKIIYFMRQFDVCTCERCVNDTIALTLNGLLPKYLVTTPAAVDPLLSYYTNRLISDVTVEATKACMIVKENPRH